MFSHDIAITCIALPICFHMMLQLHIEHSQYNYMQALSQIIAECYDHAKSGNTTTISNI